MKRKNDLHEVIILFQPFNLQTHRRLKKTLSKGKSHYLHHFVQEFAEMNNVVDKKQRNVDYKHQFVQS